LALAQGLGNEVPSDAAVVLWWDRNGPCWPRNRPHSCATSGAADDCSSPWIPRPRRCRRARAGWICPADLEATLANDRIFWARTHQKADRIGIVPTNYSSHAALSSQAPYGTQMPVVLWARVP
jgi:hypothetical protein